MSRPMVVSQTGVGTSTPIPVDWHGLGSFGLQVEVTGTVTWTLQQAIGKTFAAPPTGEFMNSADTNLVAQTVQRQGNIAFPCTHIRLNVTAGTGTAELRVVQSGIVGS